MTERINFALSTKGVDAQTRTFEGYGSVFGNVDLGDDIVQRGAFAKSLSAHKAAGTLPVMLWMHDRTKVPGKWLEVREEPRGLYVKGELARTPLGDEAYELLKMGALAGLSIGFVPVDDGYDRDGHRVLKRVDLHEVSIVSFPMNPAARVERVKDIREYERVLHYAAGLPSHKAKVVASTTWAEVKAALALPDDPDDAETAKVATAIVQQLQSATQRIKGL